MRLRSLVNSWRLKPGFRVNGMMLPCFVASTARSSAAGTASTPSSRSEATSSGSSSLHELASVQAAATVSRSAKDAARGRRHRWHCRLPCTSTRAVMDPQESSRVPELASRNAPLAPAIDSSVSSFSDVKPDTRLTDHAPYSPQLQDRDVMKQRREPGLLFPSCNFTHTQQRARLAGPALSPGRGRLLSVCPSSVPVLARGVSMHARGSQNCAGSRVGSRRADRRVPSTLLNSVGTPVAII